MLGYALSYQVSMTQRFFISSGNAFSLFTNDCFSAGVHLKVR